MYYGSVRVYISTPVCLEDRKWCGLVGSLQKPNQVAVGSIRVFSKLGCFFYKGLNLKNRCLALLFL